MVDVGVAGVGVEVGVGIGPEFGSKVLMVEDGSVIVVMGIAEIGCVEVFGGEGWGLT